jgi:hypothetical protein
MDTGIIRRHPLTYVQLSTQSSYKDNMGKGHIRTETLNTYRTVKLFPETEPELLIRKKDITSETIGQKSFQNTGIIYRVTLFSRQYARSIATDENIDRPSSHQNPDIIQRCTKRPSVKINSINCYEK